MTRQELAALAGNSLETTIRITKAMERDGILDLSQRGKIDILDIKRLRHLAGGTS
jgi:CRP-like cAMP-binding protein